MTPSGMVMMPGGSSLECWFGKGTRALPLAGAGGGVRPGGMKTIYYALAALAVSTLAMGADETTGWAEHPVRQSDGHGGWVDVPAVARFIRHPGKGGYTYPFGLLAMDNGEVLLATSWNNGSSRNDRQAEKPAVAFSRDNGDTWSDFITVSNAIGRPMMVTDLGKGGIVFQTDPLGAYLPTEHFSADYGRTWPEWRTLQKAANGGTAVGGEGVKGFFGAEGNALVDRDASGRAVRIGQIGWNFAPGSKWPKAATSGGLLRWSTDGGRTWTPEVAPAAWRFSVPYEGKTYVRGVSEGSLVRAANGWLVASLRTDMPPRFLSGPNDDNLEGTGYSVSKDDGRTWSPVQTLFEAGRMHGHLLKLPNGDLLLTLIVRNDIANGGMRRASNRQGCEAVLSHDNGLTWDLAHKFIVYAYDEPTPDPIKWYYGKSGHLAACVLPDGSVLTVFGDYVRQGVAMIRWRPTTP